MNWTRPFDLDARFVFLSASFPSGDRATRFPAPEAAEIADATTAVVRIVLASGGRVVFGGHPTITPLVLLVAGEMRGSYLGGAERHWPSDEPRVRIYQSEVFADSITEETRRLEE